MVAKGITPQTKISIKEVEKKSYITISKLPDIDFVINPYVGCPHKCMYCYAEFIKKFTGHDMEEWGDFVDVKICKTPIDINKIRVDQTVLIGSVTDGYNPYEYKYKITQSILKQFVGSNVKLQILTKSNLVTRDIDILRKIPNVSVGISINTVDDDFRRKIEPRASSVEKRIEALMELKNAGIETYLFMAPIFPSITDYKAIIEKTKSFVDFYAFENLNLRGAYMPKVLNFISLNYPELLDIYDEIYKKKNSRYWDTLRKEIEKFCKENNLFYKMYFYHDEIKKK